MAHDQYWQLFYKAKDKKKEHARNRYQNMSDGDRQKLREHKKN